MINSHALTPVLLDGLTRKITWREASTRFGLDELIETFYATRERVTDAIAGLTDEQAAFASPVHPFWSISESIMTRIKPKPTNYSGSITTRPGFCSC